MSRLFFHNILTFSARKKYSKDFSLEETNREDRFSTMAMKPNIVVVTRSHLLINEVIVSIDNTNDVIFIIAIIRLFLISSFLSLANALKQE